MPNNCFNEIKVYGDRVDLTKLKNKIADGHTDFSFSKIKPAPKDIEDFSKWARENWTASRLPLYANLTDKQDYLLYEVSTAWVPPVKIFFALFDKYPTYDFEIYCYEEFNSFNYELNFINGKVSKELRTDWEIEPLVNNKSQISAIQHDCIRETKRIVEKIIVGNSDPMMQLPGLVEC